MFFFFFWVFTLVEGRLQIAFLGHIDKYIITMPKPQHARTHTHTHIARAANIMAKTIKSGNHKANKEGLGRGTQSQAKTKQNETKRNEALAVG